MDAKIRSYDDCVAVFKRTRDKAAGKKFGSMRMICDIDGVFKFSRYGRPIFSIHRDNTIVFDLTDRYQTAPSLSSALHKIAPFMWYRIASGRWKVASIAIANAYANPNSNVLESPHYSKFLEYVRKVSPEYYPGIAFNLVTGACINPKPGKFERVDADKRAEWLRKVKRFRKTLKVSAKLGVFNSPPFSGYRRSSVNLDLFSLFYEGVMTNSMSKDFITAMTDEVANGWHVKSDDPAVVWARIDEYYTRNSLRFREKFGVFTDE